METGIYILITKDGYRVAYSNQYTYLFGRYDDATNNFEINSKVLYNMFGDCFAFSNIDSAQAEAREISRYINCETDNGIMKISYPRYTFEELLNGSKETNA